MSFEIEPSVKDRDSFVKYASRMVEIFQKSENIAGLFEITCGINPKKAREFGLNEESFEGFHLRFCRGLKPNFILVTACRRFA